MPVFASLEVYHDESTRTAAINMAIDEALLENAIKPAIRFYQWDHPALSFGYFGRYADVANENRDLVRRWTGGGIVFHGEDLTYSVVIPARHPRCGESAKSIYEKIHRSLIMMWKHWRSIVNGAKPTPVHPREYRALAPSSKKDGPITTA